MDCDGNFKFDATQEGILTLVKTDTPEITVPEDELFAPGIVRPN